ncbi:MAG: hypothetical protein H8F28_00135 [Fibrella sp.]|nr:hypothetical protein [Armatimonadota bacterium]
MKNMTVVSQHDRATPSFSVVRSASLVFCLLATLLNGCTQTAEKVPSASTNPNATNNTKAAPLPPTVPDAAQVQIQNSTKQGQENGAAFMERVKARTPKK